MYTSGAGCSQRSQTLEVTQMKNKQESEWMFMILHWRLDDMKLRGHNQVSTNTDGNIVTDIC